jgi:hypothetical protein
LPFRLLGFWSAIRRFHSTFVAAMLASKQPTQD